MTDGWAWRVPFPQRPPLSVTRYVCPFPTCQWFHEDEGITANDYVGGKVSVQIAPEHRPSIGWALRGETALGALHATAMRAHAERLERVIRAHLDVHHPGWTLESVVLAVDAYNEEMRKHAKDADALGEDPGRQERHRILEETRRSIDRQIAAAEDAAGRYDHGEVLEGEVVKRESGG